MLELKNKKEMRVRLTFIEAVLGTSPANEEIYTEFIGKNAPDAPSLADEVEALGADAVAEKGMTIFPKDENGRPFLYDYQVKGFFKGACGFLNRVEGSQSKGLKAYKKEIDGTIFVTPRRIPFEFGGEIDVCQRPLRAQTMQGERVALAMSEEVPAGASIEFTVTMLDGRHEKAIREWLNYGEFSGIGQWRNSGKGRFLWDELSEDGKVIGGNRTE